METATTENQTNLQPAQYRKLPFRPLLPFFSSIKTWFTDDHVMFVGRGFCSEHYRRFYFRDIKSIFIVNTSWWILQLGCSILGTIWFLLIGLSQLSDSPAPGFLVMSSLSFLGVLIYLYLGGTCRCYIVTAATTQQLRHINRRSEALRFIRVMRPLIEQAQQELSVSSIHAELLKAAAAIPYPLQAPQRCSGVAHLALSWTSLVAAVAGLLLASVQSPAVDVVLLMLTVIGVVLTGCALISQHNTHLPAGLKVTSFGAMVGMVALAVIILGGAFALLKPIFIAVFALTAALGLPQAIIYRRRLLRRQRHYHNQAGTQEAANEQA